MRRDDYSVLPKYLKCESNSSLAHLWICAKAQKIMVSLLSCGEVSCYGVRYYLQITFIPFIIPPCSASTCYHIPEC